MKLHLRAKPKSSSEFFRRLGLGGGEGGGRWLRKLSLWEGVVGQGSQSFFPILQNLDLRKRVYALLIKIL